ncbi:hypothetical protein GCM10009546_41270 [Actinomadura livida]|uniref:Non-specific serine/threonine protein kinase n=2 Tax=Actinomadura livida TaxID=79909 RepID=A0ABN1EUZ8_9ACTN|nr:hypothetical protein GCM10010208_70970 [Actinomadura livida]
MPDVTALQPGDPSRLGHYEVAGRLGEGGQGVVYLGRGPDGEHVAIKLLRTRLGRDGKAHQRFVREVAAAERVAPFCTARVVTADLHGETPYVVSEYVDGPSLHDRVRDEGPLTGTALDRLAIVTATALAAVHEAGIVHRDFKPGNVLLAPDGPRVIDFGIARVLDATSTLTSQLVGTPAFMAPEQINGEETGPAGDMFAWAGTIIYAATGRPPFGGDTVAAVMNRIVHHEPDLGALTGPLREVVAAALNKDPAQRPTPRDVIDHMVKSHAAPPAPPAAAPSAPPAAAPPAPPAAAPHQFAAQPPPMPAPPQRQGPVPSRPTAGVEAIGPALGAFVALYLLTAPFGLVAMGDYRGILGHGTGFPILSDLFGYLLPAALAAPLGAKFGRRFPNGAAGAALGLILIGVILIFLTPSYMLLMVGRVVSGLGAGALAALLALRVGHLRGGAVAAMIGAGVLAVLLGFLAGPVLAAPFGWRLVFVAALPPTLLALLASVLGGLTATLQTGNAQHHPPPPR